MFCHNKLNCLAIADVLDLIQIIDTLYDHYWASGSSKIYLESNERLDKIVSSKYQLIKDSKAGNVYYGILKLISQKSLK